jgi:hypothetical protein
VIRHRDDPSRDVAFVGGIDLAHNRRDDADHGGDPQPSPDRGVRRAPPVARRPGRDPRSRRATTSRPCSVSGGRTRRRCRGAHPQGRRPVAPPRHSPDGLPAQSPPRPGRGAHRAAAPDLPRSSGTGATTRSRGAESAAWPAATRRRSRAPSASSTSRTSTSGVHGVAEPFEVSLREHPDLRLSSVIPLVPDISGLEPRAAVPRSRASLVRLMRSRRAEWRRTASRTTPALRSTYTPRSA